MFIEVAVPVPGLPPLTYHCPEQLQCSIGMRVVVTVGRQAVTGVITGINLPAPENIKVKSVVKVIDDNAILPSDLLQMGKWLSGYYRCSFGEALHAMLPGSAKPSVKQVYQLAEQASPRRTTGLAAMILDRLRNGATEKKQLLKDLPASAGRILSRLEKDKLIKKEFKLVDKRTKAAEPEEQVAQEEPKSLTADQQEALQAIADKIDEHTFSGFLLYGVTGSGKTEVYLQAIDKALAQGKGAILLLPEIALTTHMQERIKARLQERVAVLHSQLTPKQRMEAWTRLLHGKAMVALGARSAIFAPVKNLGLIIVDEEYEASYKQDDTPRYHARDLAAVRAKQSQAVFVYGAATPSLESYYNATQGKLNLLSLPRRIDQKKLPQVELVDMSQEYGASNRYPVFSSRLLAEIKLRLEKKEQIILFLNRRGFAPLVMCPNCKHTLECPDCSVSLVYHRDNDKLHCHSCGQQFPPRPACPKCGTACVKLIGSGTQRIEDELERCFPGSRVGRLDQDKTRKKGVLEETLAQFEKNEIDILVGTQMVAKGIDFQNVTLVGIISADTALHLPDFRAEERTFQLLVQVAGRAGRGGKPGLVIAQTAQIEHEVLAIAAKHDYATFYEREIVNRKELGYPPFMRLVNIVCRSSNSESARKQAALVAERARSAATPRDQVLGPAPSPHQRVAKESRFQVLIKAHSHQTRSAIITAIQNLKIRHDVKMIIDVDPANLL